MLKLFARFNVDIEKPALSVEELRDLDNINRLSLPFVIMGYALVLALVGICFYEILNPHPINDVLFPLTACALFAYGWIYAERLVAIHKLAMLSDEQSVELALLLNDIRNLTLHRYAHVVRTMGREYRQIEFFNMKEFAEKACTRERAEAAKNSLYGESESRSR